MSKLKPLLDGLDILGGVFGGGRRAGIGDEVWRKRLVATVAIIEAENPWASCGIALRVSISRHFIDPALVEGPSSRRARACYSGSDGFSR